MLTGKPLQIAIAGGALGLGLVALYVWKKGGVAAAAESVGAAAVDAAGGVASGVVGGIGASVGLPTPSQTTTEASVARWIIDHYGHFEASKWAGAPAYLSALTMSSGSGTPPAPGTELAQRFPIKAAPTTGDFARADRASGNYDGADAPAWWQFWRGSDGSSTASEPAGQASAGGWFFP